MKKKISIFIGIIFALSAITPALAVQFAGVSDNPFEQSSTTQTFYPLTIIAENEGEITAQHGLNLILPVGAAIQWEKEGQSLTFSGSAETKVTDPLVPEISDNLYYLHIPINEDFEIGEQLEISNLKVRTYRTEVSNRSLEIDINGDKLMDTVDLYQFWVKDAKKTDFTKPYLPEDFEAAYNAETNQVHIAWKNSPDYDFYRIILYRERERDGMLEEGDILAGAEMQYTDTDVALGDKLRYWILSTDTNGNVADPVEVSIELTDEEEVVEELPEEPVETPEPVVEESEEIKSLNRLYGYYKVRHEIKCRAGLETSSNCLWAKINLVYAQELTGRSDVDSNLSTRDLYLMALRVKWPEMRYETNCIEAEEPAKTCPALEKSLKRIHYFID